uniref:Uncharacterized protein n=1 Tax=Oryza meridionalis TaxID=40149 RepID=A0A0E0C1K4_9ORYZ
MFPMLGMKRKRVGSSSGGDSTLLHTFGDGALAAASDLRARRGFGGACRHGGAGTRRKPATSTSWRTRGSGRRLLVERENKEEDEGYDKWGHGHLLCSGDQQTASSPVGLGDDGLCRDVMAD